MSRSTFGIIAFSIVAAASCACRTFDVGDLAMLAPDYHSASIDVLARDVEGEDCVSVYDSFVLPSYGKAIANALQKVPKANVMRDVSFEYQTRFFWNCAWVKGNAGKFR